MKRFLGICCAAALLFAVGCTWDSFFVFSTPPPAQHCQQPVGTVQVNLQTYLSSQGCTVTSTTIDGELHMKGKTRDNKEFEFVLKKHSSDAGATLVSYKGDDEQFRVRAVAYVLNPTPPKPPQRPMGALGAQPGAAGVGLQAGQNGVTGAGYIGQPGVGGVGLQAGQNGVTAAGFTGQPGLGGVGLQAGQNGVTGAGYIGQPGMGGVGLQAGQNGVSAAGYVSQPGVGVGAAMYTGQSPQPATRPGDQGGYQVPPPSGSYPH